MPGDCVCVGNGDLNQAADASFTFGKDGEVEHYYKQNKAVFDLGIIRWKHTDTGGSGRISVELLGLDAFGPLDLTHNLPPPLPLLRTSLF